MLKALLKKQFMELGSFYFLDKKTGKRRSKGGTVGMIILFGFLFVCLAGSFAGMSALFAASFIPLNLAWLFFAMMGMISVFLGSIIDMFAASTSLYASKDNGLLLSMPIPPSKILFSRMAGLYVWGTLFLLIVFVPAIVVYLIVIPRITAVSIIFPILTMLVSSFFSLALTCVLGYVVAAISSRLKNKTILTVLLTLLFIGIYYVCYFRLNTLLTSAAANPEKLESAIKGPLFFFYFMGSAASGDFVSFLAFTAITAAVFFAVYFVLSKTFVRIATRNRGSDKTVYKERAAKVVSAKKALLKKELKRFFTSPAYMLNIGLGIMVMPIFGVFFLIRTNYFRGLLLPAFSSIPLLGELLPAMLVASAILFSSMGCFTAPSISLEGKNLWILQTMPLNCVDILEAKQSAHLYLNIGSVLIFVLSAGFVLQVDSSELIIVVLLCYIYCVFCGAFGLFMNLKKPNLTWTNETVPIKQSMSVAVTMFGGWGIALLYAAGAYFIGRKVSVRSFNLGFLVVLAFVTRFLKSWIRKEGSVILATLS